MIKRHEDFEKTIAAQEEKFTALKRQTKCEEQSFGHQQRLDDILNEVKHDGIDLTSINEDDKDVDKERNDSTSPQALGDDERVSHSID